MNPAGHGYLHIVKLRKIVTKRLELKNQRTKGNFGVERPDTELTYQQVLEDSMFGSSPDPGSSTGKVQLSGSKDNPKIEIQDLDTLIELDEKENDNFVSDQKEHEKKLK